MTESSYESNIFESNKVVMSVKSNTDDAQSSLGNSEFGDPFDILSNTYNSPL